MAYFEGCKNTGLTLTPRFFINESAREGTILRYLFWVGVSPQSKIISQKKGTSVRFVDFESGLKKEKGNG